MSSNPQPGGKPSSDGTQSILKFCRPAGGLRCPPPPAPPPPVPAPAPRIPVPSPPVPSPITPSSSLTPSSPSIPSSYPGPPRPPGVPLPVSRGLKSSSFISDGADEASLPWTRRFQPDSPQQLVGNQNIITEIEQWLRNWQKSFMQEKEQRDEWVRSVATTASSKKSRSRRSAEESDSEDDDQPKKRTRRATVYNSAFIAAYVITGAPGIGKTSTVHALAKSLGFELREFNASDCRSVKAVRETIAAATYGPGLRAFQPSAGSARLPGQHRILLLLDEVDGMNGNADRGGAAALAKIIQATAVPIICIGNDKGADSIKTLMNLQCVKQVTFRRPTAAQMIPRLSAISSQAGLKLSRDVVTFLCEETGNDLRQILNILQQWSVTSREVSDVEEARNLMRGATKTVEVDIFQAVPRLFTTKLDLSLAARARYVYVDSHAVPLMVQQNYLLFTPYERTCKDGQHGVLTEKPCPLLSPETFHRFAEAADAISYGDVISTAQFSSGGSDFSLGRDCAWVQSVTPAWNMAGKCGQMFLFPMIFGKESSAKSQRSRASTFATACGGVTRDLSHSISCAYAPFFNSIFNGRLRIAGKSGVAEQAMGLIKSGIKNPDQLQFALECVRFDGVRPNVEPPQPALMTAFTKALREEGQEFKQMAAKQIAAEKSTLAGSLGAKKTARKTNQYITRLSQVSQPFWVPASAVDPAHPELSLVGYRFDDALAREWQSIVVDLGCCDMIALRYVALLADASMTNLPFLVESVYNSLSTRFFKDEVVLCTRRVNGTKISVFVRVMQNVFCRASAREAMEPPSGLYVDVSKNPDTNLINVEVVEPEALARMAMSYPIAPQYTQQESAISSLPPGRQLKVSFQDLSRPAPLTRKGITRALKLLTVYTKALGVTVQAGDDLANVQGSWLARLTDHPDLSDLEHPITAQPEAVLEVSPDLEEEIFAIPLRARQSGGMITLKFVAPLFRERLGLRSLESLEKAGIISCKRADLVVARPRQSRAPTRSHSPEPEHSSVMVRGGAGPVFKTLTVPFPRVTVALSVPAEGSFSTYLSMYAKAHKTLSGVDQTVRCILSAMSQAIPVSNADAIAAFDFCTSPQFIPLTRLSLFTPEDFEDALLSVPGAGSNGYSPLCRLPVSPLLHVVLARLASALAFPANRSVNQRVNPVLCDAYCCPVRFEPPEPQKPSIPKDEGDDTATSSGDDSEESESESTEGRSDSPAYQVQGVPRNHPRVGSRLVKEVQALSSLRQRGYTRRSAAAAAERALEEDDGGVSGARSSSSYEPSDTDSEPDEYSTVDSDSTIESESAPGRARPPRNLRQTTLHRAEVYPTRLPRNLRSRSQAISMNRPESTEPQSASESEEAEEIQQLRQPSSTDDEWAEILCNYINSLWPITSQDPNALAAFAIALACVAPSQRPQSYSKQQAAEADEEQDEVIPLPEFIMDLLGTDEQGEPNGRKPLPRIPLIAMPVHIRLMLMRYLTGEAAQSERAREQLQRTRTHLVEAERRLSDHQKALAEIERNTGEDEKQRKQIETMRAQLEETEHKLADEERIFGEEHEVLLQKLQEASTTHAVAIQRQIQRHLAKFQKGTNQTLSTRINKLRREIKAAESNLHNKLQSKMIDARHRVALSSHRVALEATRQTLLLGTDSDGRQYFRMGSLPSLLAIVTPPGVSPPSAGEYPDDCADGEMYTATRKPICLVPRWSFAGGDWLPELTRFAFTANERQLSQEASKYYELSRQIHTEKQETQPETTDSLARKEPMKIGSIAINWAALNSQEWGILQSTATPV